jgi:O-antigen ligase
MGFIAGLMASFASGSRGGWLAIPVFIAIFVYFRISKLPLKMILTSLIAAMITFYIALFANSVFQHRADELVNDATRFGQGNRDTSTGVRWQLYKAAIDVFSRHPVFGVGPEGFALEMKPMMEAGKLTPDAAELGRGEVHNDILSKCAEMGLFGLIAILSIYLAPIILFWRATKAKSTQVKRSGILGLTFVSGMFVFGLSVEILNLTMATAFYSFTVAVLLAACFNIHYDEYLPNDNPN